jgi:hypothetical protein
MNPQIRSLATKQQGNVTHAQLRSLGVGREAIKFWARKGLLHREHLGVYAVGRPATAPLEKASAAVLACGPEAVLSHASAMTLWGFWKRWSVPFEVSTQQDRRPRGITVHQTRTLYRRDVRVHYGIRTTSPARTIYDMQPRLTDAQLTRAVNNALHSPFLTEGQLQEFLTRHKAPRLAGFTSTSHGLTRSELEDDFAAFCLRYGLPRPVFNVIVSYLADVDFPQHRLIVELDSWQFHSSRIDFEKDRNRDADQLSDGIPTVRITHERMTHDPGREADRLHRILTSRRAPGQR